MDLGQGATHYLRIARQIAECHRSLTLAVLPKMVLARTLYGISAIEYAQYGLNTKTLRDISLFVTKKQTTALFSRINPDAEKWRVDDKLAFHRLCAKENIPTPPIHFILSRRFPTDISDYTVVPRLSDALSRFAGQEETCLFLKPRSDSLGTGTRFIRLLKGQAHDVENRPIAMDAYEAELQVDMERDDYLVQSFVTSHPEIAKLGSGPALGTMRIDTYTDDQGMRLLFALLRIPCGKNISDNFLAGRSGNLICAVNTNTGEIMPAYGRRNSKFPNLLECYRSNPDTGQAIAGQFIPNWKALCQDLERACHVFKSLPILGWDVALTPNGPVFIEANSNPDIVGEQVTSGIGARTMLRPVLQHLGSTAWS